MRTIKKRNARKTDRRHELSNLLFSLTADRLTLRLMLEYQLGSGESMKW